MGRGSKPLLGAARLRGQLRKHQQTVELGKIVQGEWEGLVKKGIEGRALGTLTSTAQDKPRKEISQN